MKKLTLFGDNSNPAMQFEGLARAVFNDCDKSGDPFGIAHQEVFGFKQPTHKIITDEFRRALIIVLVKMVIDNPQNTKLLALEKEAWNIQELEDIKRIIQSALVEYSVS
jgi:hypothetical protein